MSRDLTMSIFKLGLDYDDSMINLIGLLPSQIFFKKRINLKTYLNRIENFSNQIKQNPRNKL